MGGKGQFTSETAEMSSSTLAIDSGKPRSVTKAIWYGEPNSREAHRIRSEFWSRCHCSQSLYKLGGRQRHKLLRSIGIALEFSEQLQQ